MILRNRWVLAFLALALLTGCSLSNEQRAEREKILKNNINSFKDAVIQGNWDTIYSFSDGSSGNSSGFKDQLTQTWVPNAVLTGGETASLAWVDDGTAKVKLVWAFQAGGVGSFSAETFIWVWKDGAWKYHGRALR
jgi:hypothetical protein